MPLFFLKTESSTSKTASDFETNLDCYMVKKAAACFKTCFKHAFTEDPILKRLKEAVKALDRVAAQVMVFYWLVQEQKDKQQKDKHTVGGRETSSVLNVETEVFGRDEVKEEIVKMLLNSGYQPTSGNFHVLPIVGVGGIGKTTLAQSVYNDQRVMDHFKLKMWVCISKPFDVVLLTKKLYESVFKKKPDFDNFELVHQELTKELKSKKFLVVFDDAWNDNDKSGWEKLLAPLKFGEKGSMILLTTRMEEVAKTIGRNVMNPIFLKGLKEDEYWNLFAQCAFGDEIQNNDKKLEKIGRDNVQKLKGSPLAAKTIGAVLRSNLNEKHWRNVLERERWWSLKSQKNGIMPSLRLSYQHLDSHLKPCFSFCSLFPQDHEFNKEDLIYMWMAVGLVPRYGDGKKRLEDIGSEFFDELVNKSFLEKSTFGYYVMHDLLHDLATFVSKEECFRYTGRNFANIPYTVRNLSIHVSDHSEFDNFPNLGRLRTLILRFDGNHPNSLHVINGIIKKLKKLRILHLSGDNLYDFPHDVSNLLHLRYLHTCFSHKTLPSRISNLYLLQKMNFIVGCKFDDIHEFNVGNLISLRNLRFYIKGRLKLVGIGRLTSLQDIGTNYYVGESGCKISELKDLIELTDLSISGIGYVGSIEEAIEDAIEANLSNKVNLQRLCLSWEDCDSKRKDTKFHEELLNELKPHFRLNTLLIKNHCGRRPPVWMKTPSDFRLVKLIILCCMWECLPVLEELPFLEFLELSNMDALKKVCHNCSGASQAGFPSLKELNLKDMPELEEWLLSGEPSIWMPNLRKLTVEKCPKLNCLPPLPLSLERLNLFNVGLVALPEIWHDRNKSQSSPSLVQLSIDHCSKLASLSGGMFEHPEYFTALHMLYIGYCKELMHLPQGGFSKFVALNELSIVSCPLVRGHMVLPEYFLPSSLEKLNMYLIGSSDVAFSIALEHVDSIVSLDIGECTVTSLTSKGVFGRWKNLREVRLTRCEELLSLECLKFCSLDLLHVGGCSKLISAIPSQSELQKSEIEKMKEEGTSSQADIITTETPTDFRKWFLVCSTCLRNLLASRTVMFSVLRIILSKLLNAPILRMVSTPISSEEETEIPSFSVNGLVIDDPSLLNVEPLRSLASVQRLKITDCSKIKTLPVQWLLQNRNSLQDIYLRALFSLESLPVELQSLSSLRVLILYGASKLESLPELPPRLERLTLYGASKLESLPELPPRLEWLTLHGASKLESLPELPPRLERLTLHGASKLESLPELPPRLERLTLHGASKLESLPELPPRLERLTLHGASKLESLPELPPRLERLTLHGASKLESLPELPPRLERLTLHGASKLESLPELPPRLVVLTLDGASKLESLPELPPLLEEITIGDASEELRRRCRKTGEDWPKLAGKRVIFVENHRVVETINGRPEAMKIESAEW